MNFMTYGAIFIKQFFKAASSSETIVSVTVTTTQAD